MKAIKTKYLPETTHRPARIKASTHNGPNLTMYFSHDDNDYDRHKSAALELCKRYSWPESLAGGHLGEDEMVWCFVA